jgi:hypothetical protein
MKSTTKICEWSGEMQEDVIGETVAKRQAAWNNIYLIMYNNNTTRKLFSEDHFELNPPLT